MNKLKLIGVPIGNIEDITIRALRALFACDVILAEDTRNYIKLRNILSERFENLIKESALDPRHSPELISYREQNHEKVILRILENLKFNKTVGFVSDAGMPAISDPGFKLVRDVLANGFEIEIIPGPSAVDSSLVLSGLPTDKFTFIGFLPRERGKILKLITQNSQHTIIYYESPFRVIKSLEIIAAEYPEAQVAACNDLTKKFEKIYRGKIGDVVEMLKKEKKVVGEWSIVINCSN